LCGPFVVRGNMGIGDLTIFVSREPNLLLSVGFGVGFGN
jgi:hypothetical protein